MVRRGKTTASDFLPNDAIGPPGFALGRPQHSQQGVSDLGEDSCSQKKLETAARVRRLPTPRQIQSQAAACSDSQRRARRWHHDRRQQTKHPAWPKLTAAGGLRLA